MCIQPCLIECGAVCWLFHLGRYLSGFLSVKEKFAPAHRLMGLILEALDQSEKAVEAYKRSLDIDERQKDVILKSKSLTSSDCVNFCLVAEMNI